MKNLFFFIFFLTLPYFFLGCSENNNQTENKDTTNTMAGDSYGIPKQELLPKKNETIDIYNLIRILLPDEEANESYVSWKYLDDYKDLFSLSSGEYDAQHWKGYHVGGNIINHGLNVPSKKGRQIEDLNIIHFIGSETGYKQFQIIAASCINFDEYDIKSLFGDHKYEIKSLVNCDDTEVEQYDLWCSWEVKFPGKKPFGLFITGSQCGGRNHFGDDMIIKCFLKVDEAKDAY